MAGRVVALTGGSGAIGREIARRVVAEGGHVAVGYHSNRDAAESLVEELAPQGEGSVALYVDVRSKDSVDAFVQGIVARLGAPDCLINNAGVARFRPTTQLSEADWDTVLDTNVKGPFLCSQAVLPLMMESRMGDIVNISSIAGSIGSFEGLAYAASKAALDQLTHSLALEYGQYNIRVNGVAPGRIATPFRRQSAGVYFDAMLAQTPLGRLGSPMEVADAAVYMASRSCPFITGQTLTVSGGLATVWLEPVVPDPTSKLR